MLSEEAVDLQRRDLVAAARDDLLGASDQLDAAVVTQPGEIAGAEESVYEGGLGEGGVVEIAEHSVWRLDLQLAALTAAAVGDAECDVVGRLADRAKSLRLIRGRQAEVAGAGFGEPEEIEDRSIRSRGRIVLASAAPSGSPPVRIIRSFGAAIRPSAISMRSIVGTQPNTVAPFENLPAPHPMKIAAAGQGAPPPSWSAG